MGPNREIEVCYHGYAAKYTASLGVLGHVSQRKGVFLSVRERLYLSFNQQI